MVASKLNKFGGMIPIIDDMLLPDSNASDAMDIWTTTGALEGIWQPQLLYTAASVNTRRVFRIPTNYYTKEHLADAFFIEFSDKDTDVIHAPMADDTYDRYYWCAPSIPPRYAPKANILSGTLPNYNSFKLGIPTPATAPTIVVTGGTTPTIARAYVYTWVSTYGEEGPPSPPSIVTTGNINGTWTLTLTAPLSPDTTDRTLATVNIYRTITASDGTVAYYLVDSKPIATTTYADTKTDVSIVGGPTLLSVNWTPPPSDLQGMVHMANGMIVGWRVNEIWFCEPYRPHAWPSAYTLITQHPIVGLGVVNNVLIICTVSKPYSAAGSSPGNMNMVKIDAIEPCLSRASIVSTPAGVVYASPNGLVIASPMYGQVKVVTGSLFSKEDWLDLFDMQKLCGATLGNMYFGFGVLTDGCFQVDTFESDTYEQLDFTDSQNGVLIDTDDQRIAYTPLSSDAPTSSVMNDVWTGEVIVQYGTGFYWINQTNTNPRRPYRWVSKKYQMDLKKNMSAMRIFFDIPSDVPPPFLDRNVDPNMTFDGQMYGVFRIYNLDKLIMAREIRVSGELWRIPSGSKSEFWTLEIEARVKIKNVQMATSVAELANV